MPFLAFNQQFQRELEVLIPTWENHRVALYFLHQTPEETGLAAFLFTSVFHKRHCDVTRVTLPCQTSDIAVSRE